VGNVPTLNRPCRERQEPWSLTPGLTPRASKDQAVGEDRRVVEAISGWRAHFAKHGVTDRDIEMLAEQIDRPFLRQQREDLLVD